jgi:hypothetical protein
MFGKRTPRTLTALVMGAIALGLVPPWAPPVHASGLVAAFYAPLTAGVTTADDGDNTSIHFLLTAAPGAVTVDLEYSSPDLGLGLPMSIGSATKANGVFSFDWTPSPIDEANFLAVGGLIDVTATPDVGEPATISLDPNTIRTAVDISNAPGERRGVFVEPYDGANNAWMMVRGTTDSALPVNLRVFDVASTTPLPGSIAAPVVGAEPIKTFTAAVNTKGATSARVIVNAATTDVGAESDDAEVLEPYLQTITTVDAYAITPGVAPGDTSQAVVTVLDQAGAPIYGAHVWVEDASTHDVVASGDTGLDGTRTFQALGGSPEGTVYNFVVDTTAGTDTFEAGADFSRPVTITEYIQAAASIAVSSTLGSAMDLDESTAVSARLLDQLGNPIKDKSLNYRWTQTTPDGTQGTPSAVTTVQDGNGDGAFEIATPAFTAGKWLLEVWGQDGGAGPGGADVVAPEFNIAVGNASFVMDGLDPIQAAAGTSVDVVGRLVITGDGPAIDGSPLAARSVIGAFTPGTGGDAALSSPSPASTDAEGRVVFTVADPIADPQQAETGGVVDVTDAAARFGAGQIHVDFPLTVTPGKVTVTPGTKLIDDAATPGRPMNFDIHVQNAQGDALGGVQVAVATTHGVFTPFAADEASLTPEAEPAAGALFGEWKSLGTKTVVTTDGSGNATVTLNMERDPGFDDNGLVTTVVLAAAGTSKGEATADFTSADPLNGAAFSMSVAAGQGIRTLPKIRADLEVAHNLLAVDQFGNLLASPDVAVTSTSDVASWDCPEHRADANATCPALTTNFPGTVSPVVAFSNDGVTAGHQDLAAIWTAPTNTWESGPPIISSGLSRTSGTHDLAATDVALDWYALDHTKGEYTLVPAAKAVRVGTTARDVLRAVDEFGQPIPGLSVTFARSGPGGAKDRAQGVTNAHGRARFDFTGSQFGDAKVTATVSAGDTLVGSDSNVIHFKYGVPASLRGKSVMIGGGSFDRLVLTTSAKATGAIVVFKTASGVRLGRARVGSEGVAVLVVTDARPTRARNYLAVVKQTNTTLGATSNQHRMK